MIKKKIDKPMEERTIRAITGMNRLQFEEMVFTFEKVLRETTSRKRKRVEGGGRKGTLRNAREKLFFILFYFKVYPVYDLAGFLWKVDRSQACRWVAKLLPKLEKTLGYSCCLPKRKIRSTEELRESFPEVFDFFIDVTERKCQRPNKSEKNLKRRYSGKKKMHTRKNTVIVDENRRFLYVSPTKNGKIHDFKMFKKEVLAKIFPEGSCVWVDKGYQGIKSLMDEQIQVAIPYKKKKKEKLSPMEKKENRAINQLRVVVEHAIGGMKRMACCQVPIRNRNSKIEDQIPLLAAGLWNFHLARK